MPVCKRLVRLMKIFQQEYLKEMEQSIHGVVKVLRCQVKLGHILTQCTTKLACVPIVRLSLVPLHKRFIIIFFFVVVFHLFGCVHHPGRLLSDVSVLRDVSIFAVAQDDDVGVMRRYQVLVQIPLTGDELKDCRFGKVDLCLFRIRIPTTPLVGLDQTIPTPVLGFEMVLLGHATKRCPT